MPFRAGALALAVISIAASGEGACSQKARVLLLLEGEQRRELAARIEGQTADLDVTILSDTVPLVLGQKERLEMARSRAREARACAAAWFSFEGGQWIVHVATAGRLLERRVVTQTGAMSSSADVEAVSLVVRTALQGLMDKSRERRAPVESSPSLRPWGEVGWVGSIDGESSRGQHRVNVRNGVNVRIGVAQGRWRVGASASHHAENMLTSPLATVSLGRQHAGLMVGFDLLDAATSGGSWNLEVELGAGVARLPRTTTSASSSMVPTLPKDSWSPVAIPALRVAGRLWSSTWLSAAIGAEVFVIRPEYVVSEGGVLSVVAAPWPVQPRLTVSLAIDPS